MGRHIGKIALILWLITIVGAGAYVMSGGASKQVVGNRMAIVLSEQDRDLVLDEMRTMLSSTQQIIDGLSRGDRQQVVQAAKLAGMGSAIDLDPNFLAKLPLDFKTLGFSMHSDMDAISKAASQGATERELTSMLGATLTKCVGCHSAWEIRAVK